jgi:hypothetical protein
LAQVIGDEEDAARIAEDEVAAEEAKIAELSAFNQQKVASALAGKQQLRTVKDTDVRALATQFIDSGMEPEQAYATATQQIQEQLDNDALAQEQGALDVTGTKPKPSRKRTSVVSQPGTEPAAGPEAPARDGVVPAESDAGLAATGEAQQPAALTKTEEGGPSGFSAPPDFRYSLLQSPYYEGIDPLSLEDADFELEAMEENANRGRLTPEQFTQSEIGDRLSIDAIMTINAGLRTDPVGTIKALRSSITPTTETKGTTDGTQAAQTKQTETQEQKAPAAVGFRPLGGGEKGIDWISSKEILDLGNGNKVQFGSNGDGHIGNKDNADISVIRLWDNRGGVTNKLSNFPDFVPEPLRQPLLDYSKALEDNYHDRNEKSKAAADAARAKLEQAAAALNPKVETKTEAPVTQGVKVDVATAAAATDPAEIQKHLADIETEGATLLSKDGRFPKKGTTKRTRLEELGQLKRQLTEKLAPAPVVEEAAPVVEEPVAETTAVE